MPEPEIASNRELEELVRDPDFERMLDLVSKEVMRVWRVASSAAHRFVLSAIGEPETLSSIHRAWFSAKRSGESLGLAKVIIRRRVIDLLRKDARPLDHTSLPLTLEHAAASSAQGPWVGVPAAGPCAELELRQLIQMVRDAIACFATQGTVQQRQAQLLRRYALDELEYPELSRELAASQNALRVRVHKAMHAFRKHVEACHTDLEALLERERAPRVIMLST